MLRRMSAIVVVMLALASLMPVQALQAQTDQRCFPETGQCISGRIRSYWEENGGLPVFGFPIGPQQAVQIEGKAVQAQEFERNRLELHPENARPYDVLLGRLGVEILVNQGRPWETLPRVTGAGDGCRFFGETGHSLCEPFLSYYRTHGLEFDGRRGLSEAENLALFGYPVSEPQVETNSSGDTVLTQWFERARFEYHANNADPFKVLLGLLGNEIRRGPVTPPQPTPQPTPIPPVGETCNVPDPVSARLRPGKCVDPGTILSIDIFGFQPNEEIGFWLNAPNGEIYGTVRSLPIGPAGAVDNFTLHTDGMPSGVWSMVFEGVSSKHQSIVYFQIKANAAPPPPSSDVPASVSAEVRPQIGPPGTVFEAYGFGFSAGENIGVYVTEPSGEVFGAPFQVRANGQGQSGTVTLSTDRSFGPGVYAMTFEGVTSKHRAVAYFRIVP